MYSHITLRHFVLQILNHWIQNVSTLQWFPIYYFSPILPRVFLLKHFRLLFPMSPLQLCFVQKARHSVYDIGSWHHFLQASDINPAVWSISKADKRRSETISNVVVCILKSPTKYIERNVNTECKYTHALIEWVCVRERVCARVYVRVSQWVCKIFFFSIVIVRLTEICSFFISQICKYTWHISLYNLCWDDVLYV